MSRPIEPWQLQPAINESFAALPQCNLSSRKVFSTAEGVRVLIDGDIPLAAQPLLAGSTRWASGVAARIVFVHEGDDFLFTVGEEAFVEGVEGAVV